MDASLRAVFELFHSADGPPTEEMLELRNKRGTDMAESQAFGSASLLAGDYATAVSHFRRAVEQQEKGESSAILDLADTLAYGDELPAAYRQYEKALRAKESADPHVGLGDICRRYGRYRDAIEHLQSAIRLEPENPYSHYKLSELLNDLGERKRAVLAIQHAIALKPDDSFFHFWLGELLARMGALEDSLTAYRAAIELSPGDDHLYLRTAVAFWRLQRYPEAIKALRLASDLDPDKLIYHALMANLYYRQGKNDEARPEAEKAAKMDAYDSDLLARILKEVDQSPR
jgi:tetratricopeptide (TPR) repeat protein